MLGDMNNSAARYVVTVAAAAALLVGVGVGATALSRTGDTPDTTVGEAVQIPQDDSTTVDDSSQATEPAEVPHTPEVDDLADDHDEDSVGDAPSQDTRVALPPSDASTKLGTAPVSSDDDESDDHEDESDEVEDHHGDRHESSTEDSDHEYEVEDD